MTDPDKELKDEFEARLIMAVAPIFDRYLTDFRQSILDRRAIPNRKVSERDFEFTFDRHYRLVQDAFRSRVFTGADLVETTPDAVERFLLSQEMWRQETAPKIAAICAETNVVQAERVLSEAEKTLKDDSLFSRFELSLLAGVFLRRLFEARKKSIAITETQGPSESTKINKSEAVENSSLSTAYVVVQTWNSLLDGRERASHGRASGQTQPTGKPFSIGASSLYYPGDPGAPAEERVGCRCYLTSSIISLR